MTGDKLVEQYREHAEIYRDKVNSEQSKYIALHVGIFWCIGTFIIKNEDSVIVNLDLKTMYEHLTKNKMSQDSFIGKRTDFIKQLIAQRKLKVSYNMTETEKNLASKVLEKRIGT